MQRLGSYKYRYGSASAPNRILKFEREEGQSSSFRAKLIAIVDGKKKEINTIPGCNIIVVGASSSEISKAVEEFRKTHKKPYLAGNRPITELNESEQNEVLANLKGSWRISIQTRIPREEDQLIERVAQLTLFDPN